MNLKNFIRSFFSVFCILTALSVWAEEEKVNPRKRTLAGLHITAAASYVEWKKDQAIKIIDIRTPEEYSFVGHPAMAHNIPLFYMKSGWYMGKRPSMVKNQSFVEQISKVAGKGAKIFLICRSGGRSAVGANILFKAGFKNVYSVTDGFEGDKIKDNSSPFYGLRKKNGWKNSSIPWTYSINKELLHYSE